MMNIRVEMPPVSSCMVSDCAYNRDDACHAKAVTIGHGMEPSCDTFLNETEGRTGLTSQAGVGACKIAACHFNRDLECTADRIEIALKGADASCMTALI